MSAAQDAAADAAFEPTFGSGTGFSTPLSPIAIAIGDVNDDGAPDIVVASSAGAIFSVLLDTTTRGAATPTFAPRADFSVLAVPWGIAVGDLNRDGRPDFVLANPSANTISVVINATPPGSQTVEITSNSSFATPSGPNAIAFADINGDGLADLVVANSYASSVSVFLNTTTAGASAPTFAPRFDVAVAGATTVAATDMNGDGKPDVIAGGAQGISILLNATATGASAPAFAAAADFATGQYPYGIAVADINGDGRPDLAVANDGLPGIMPGSTSILLSTTDPNATAATFGSPLQVATGTNPYSMAAADFNADGRPDVIVAHAGSPTVVLLDTTATGSMSATFAAALAVAQHSGDASIGIADFNGDGRPDLALAHRQSNSVDVVLAR